MNPPSSDRLRPLVSIAIILAVVIGVYYAARALPLDVLGEIRERPVRWSALPLLIGVQVVFMLAGAELWRRIVRVSTGAQQGFVAAYVQMVVVGVGKYVPGKVWGFLARTGDMYRQNIPLHLSVMSNVVEQLLLLTGALIVMLAASLILFPDMRTLVLVAGVVSLGVVGYVSLKVPAITSWLLRRRGAADLPVSADDYHPFGILRFAVGYASLWILSGVLFSTIYFSLFDVPVTAERVSALVLANTAGIVVGFFAFFVPAGIGVREAAATIVLGAFIPVREALLAAIAYRAWIVLFDGVNAALMLLREARGTIIDASVDASVDAPVDASVDASTDDRAAGP